MRPFFLAPIAAFDRRARAAARWSARVARGAALGVTVLVVALDARAQERPPAQVTRFTVEDGLAVNTVIQVAQDGEGFIWVATLRGLQRFDGRTFVHASKILPGAPATLDGPISSIRVSRDSTLWVATERTLLWRRHSARTWGTIALASTFQSFAEDSAGVLWLLVNGAVGRIERDNESMRATWSTSAELLSIGCGRIATSRRRVLWLGCSSTEGSSIVALDPVTQERVTHPLGDVASIVSMHEDPTGRLWIVTREGLHVLHVDGARSVVTSPMRGIPVVDVMTETASRMLVLTSTDLMRVERREEGFVMAPAWDLRGALDAGLLARSLFADREGGIWVTTVTSGIFRVDPSSSVFTHLASRSDVTVPFTDDFILGLHEHPTRGVWIGTLAGGAYRLGDRWTDAERFNPDSAGGVARVSTAVWDFEEDDTGALWVLTEGGICRVDAPRFACYAPPTGERGGSDVVRGGDGIFWIARAENGVVSFDPRTRRFGETLPTPGRPIALHADPDSQTLWIAENSLWRVRVRQGSVVGPRERVDASIEGALPVYQFVRDGAGTLWLASASGLQRWDAARRRFVVVTLPGVEKTAVFSIVDDGEGRFWLGTAHGIVAFSPATGVARIYGRKDGIRSGEFNRRSAIMRANGEMLFGGVEGITRFVPKEVMRRRLPPPIVFTRRRTMTAAGVTDSTLDGVRTARLGPGDRALTIEFSALTYAAGPARRFRYRLEGVSDGWVETGERSVSFAALPPGRHLLRVQVDAGSSHEWHEPGQALTLDVVPPLWRRPAFRASLALLAALTLWLLHRLRLQRALATERLRLRISRDLHDEIGAGLSSIALLSDAVSRKAPSVDADRQAHGSHGSNGSDGDGVFVGERGRPDELQRIGESARQMVDHLRDIVWAIDPEGDRVEDLAQRMRDVADDLLPGIRVDFRAPPRPALDSPIGMESRRDLLLIYKELLHNVAKHAGATAVEIELSARDEEIRLRIADDGAGFDADDVRRGMGLKSMRERAARLGGTLTIAPGAARGTVATFIRRRNR